MELSIPVKNKTSPKTMIKTDNKNLNNKELEKSANQKCISKTTNTIGSIDSITSFILSRKYFKI